MLYDDDGVCEKKGTENSFTHWKNEPLKHPNINFDHGLFLVYVWWNLPHLRYFCVQKKFNLNNFYYTPDDIFTVLTYPVCVCKKHWLYTNIMIKSFLPTKNVCTCRLSLVKIYTKVKKLDMKYEYCTCIT